MEAGNRCFDESVPEEINRRIVDHVADFNLAYTEHARRYLLAEGLQPRPRDRDRLADARGARALPRRRSTPRDVLERLGLEPRAATSWSAPTARRTSTTRSGCGRCSTA